MIPNIVDNIHGMAHNTTKNSQFPPSELPNENHANTGTSNVPAVQKNSMYNKLVPRSDVGTNSARMSNNGYNEKHHMSQMKHVINRR